MESRRLFFKNIPYDLDEEELEASFRKYGDLDELKLLRNREGNLIGSGFVSFEDSNAAILALDDMNNKILFGWILHLQRAKK